MTMAMYELMTYSFKVGVCLAVFYLFFKLLLSRETFHRLNRIVVLGAMLLSFVLPLCVIEIQRELPFVPETVEPAAQIALPADPQAESFPWELLASVLFLAGAAAMLVRTLCSLVCVLRLIRRGKRERLSDGAVLVRSEQTVTPFSWGRYIVLSEQDALESGSEIILHERAHMRLHHSLDLFVTDLAACLQWFNPAMWLLRRELRAIHEYEADEAVLESGVDARQYQLLLIKKAAGRRWYSIANSFNHSKLKNRITMMLRKRSSRWATARALLVLPLSALALGAFAETVYVFPEDKVKKENVAIRISGTDSSNKPAPLYVVDGKVVSSEEIKGLGSGQIATIEIHKDSLSKAKYGEKAQNGVMYITLKKPGEESKSLTISAEKGALENLTDLTGRVSKVTVVSGASGKNLVVVDEPNPDSLQGRVVRVRYPKEPENKIVLIDGRISTEVEMNAIPSDRLASVRVMKGGPDTDRQVIEVQTKEYQTRMKAFEQQARDAAKAIAENPALAEVLEGRVQADITVESMKAGIEGLETAQKAIESSRKALDATRNYMDSDEWEKTQQALDEAQKELDDARREHASRLETARKIADLQTSDKLNDIVVVGYSTEKKKESKKGEELLYILDGKRISEKELLKLDPAQIETMNVLKDKTAVEKYGKKARNGAIEIFTKKK